MHSNIQEGSELKKIRVLFPYIEAGYGHIMPMKSIEETFRRKYGDKVEIVSSHFFTETGDRHLARFEKMMSNQVKLYNTIPVIGRFATVSCEFFGTRLSTFGSMQLIAPFAWRRGVEHMKELDPDVVISTHWASNFYAEKQKDKPLTVMYCPDAQLNQLFEYHSDLNLISMPYGYMKALRKKQYNIHNMKLVPFFIRNEAFSISRDKKQLRRDLGIPEDKFTIVLAEGGYGIGKIDRIARALISGHVPMTVIAVCGTNTKLYEKMKGYRSTEEVTFIPYGFTDRILELEAAADLFSGKSGNILAESTFFGNPSLVTHFANLIERNIADHYINTVGCTIKEFSVKKAAAMMKEFALDQTKLDPYRRAAEAYHVHYGSDEAADVIWEKITETYPELR